MNTRRQRPPVSCVDLMENPDALSKAFETLHVAETTYDGADPSDNAAPWRAVLDARRAVERAFTERLRGLERRARAPRRQERGGTR